MSRFSMDLLRTMAQPERWQSYARQKETTVSSDDSLKLRPLSKWEFILKEIICSL